MDIGLGGKDALIHISQLSVWIHLHVLWHCQQSLITPVLPGMDCECLFCGFKVGHWLQFGICVLGFQCSRLCKQLHSRPHAKVSICCRTAL